MKLLSSQRLPVYLGLLCFGLKLWLVQAHPLMATDTPHDDLLFVSQAHSLLGGNWLGEYNQLTLIKGQFYPIFIALGYLLGVPLLLFQQLLYGLAAVVVVWAVAPLVRNRWLLLLIFLVLVFNPFSYNYPAVGRVLRLGIYAPLGMLVLATTVGLLVRSHHSLRHIAGWAVGCGLCLAAFWNTREESIWIAPSLVILYLPLFWSLRRYQWRNGLGRLLVFLLPFIILGGLNSFIVYKNDQVYGVPARIELDTPEFKSAYGGLLRIQTEDWLQFFPVTHSARQQAYEASPAFRELEPFLDGPVGKPWMDLCVCTDLPAAFFIWAFRDSVAAAGYYKDGPTTLEFYRRMGEDIDRACNDETLDCRPRITSLVPAWHREYNKLLVGEYLSVLGQIVSFRDFSATTAGMLSRGEATNMRMYEVVTGEQLLTSKPEIVRTYPKYHARLNDEKVRILNDIGALYKSVLPILFILAGTGFILFTGVGIYKRSLSVLTIAAGASLAGILAIAFILTLLKITSYTEIERAMHSAYGLVLIFIALVVLEIIQRSFFSRKYADQTTDMYPVEHNGPYQNI